MKSVKLILVLSVLSILFSSCYKRNGWGMKGKGSNVSETRSTSSFTKINLAIDADVIFTQDSNTSIEVVGQSNVLSVLETRVSDQVLKINYKRAVWDHNRVKVIIHAPTINGIDISGSGDILVQNKITCKDLNVDISGSGNILVPSMFAENFTLKISGSGDVEVKGGTVTKQNYIISGSGNVKCEKFESSNTICNVSGSGNIWVNVIESLKVSISGSGDVHYTGKPSVSADISGSGKLIHL